MNGESRYMQVDLIFKIAAVGMVVALLNIILSKSGRDEQALMVTLIGLIVVLAVVAEQFAGLVENIRSSFGLG